MIDSFQSTEAVRRQISEGYQYYFLLYNNRPEGYMAIDIQPEKIFLSKLYLRQAVRGKGLAKQAVLYLEQLCRQQAKKSIWLTVNKNNTASIAAYKKMEFQVVSAQQQDIGNGFVMDDYIMEKIVVCK